MGDSGGSPHPPPPSLALGSPSLSIGPEAVQSGLRADGAGCPLGGGGRGKGEVYSAYAAHYDAQGQSQWSLALIHFVLATLLPRDNRQPRTALDLACGTGTAALALARAGLATVGLDRSRAMLRIASAKARDAATPCHFVRADLRNFAFARPFDLVTCCYDSLNYLTDPADLRAAFARTRAALTPGGLFVCDLTTARAYATAHDDPTPALALGDTTHTYSTAWDPETRLAATTIAFATSTDTVTEHHLQRAYERQEIEAHLRVAGLRPLATLAALPLLQPTLAPPGPETARVIYVAEPA